MVKSSYARKSVQKSCERFQIDKSLRFGSCCSYLRPGHSEEGIKKITNDIKEQPEYIEKTTKEGIDQLKATAQHLSEKILTLGNSTAQF